MLTGVSALAIVSAAPSGEDEGWKLVGNEHDIAIYHRDVPGSGIVALKARG